MSIVAMISGREPLGARHRCVFPLPDSGFVLERDLYWRAGGAGEQRILQQTGEVF